MELLIIKAGEQYIRIKDSEYHLVQLDKASVFPMNALADVRRHMGQIIAAGFEDICLKKLVLTEEDFNP